MLFTEFDEQNPKIYVAVVDDDESSCTSVEPVNRTLEMIVQRTTGIRGDKVMSSTSSAHDALPKASLPLQGSAIIHGDSETGSFLAATNQSAMQAVPMTVLTGFLGAGKTTLLNRILTGDHGLRVAVLVNDFGSINIDAELIVGIENNGDVINLANGCVCCNVRDDLVTAVMQLMVRPDQPEYILLEASGVADPSGIALTFMDESIRDSIRLDSIMCVVDAEQIFAAPEMMELKLRQVAFADLLILNKVDLVTPQEIARIKAWLDDRFHRYRLVEARGGNVPLEILLSVGRFDPAQVDQTPPHHQLDHLPDRDDPDCGHHVHSDRNDHSQVFRTWSYETNEPLSLEALRETTRKLPAGVYRCKGVVHTAEEPGRRVILQVVGKRVDIAVGDEWNGREPRTRIISIGAHYGVNGASLHEVFDRCLYLERSA